MSTEQTSELKKDQTSVIMHVDDAAFFVQDQTSSETSGVMDAAIAAMKNDEGYLWGWFCNLKMSAVDAGATQEVAREAACRFISTLTNGEVKMEDSPMYQKYELTNATEG